MEKELRNTTFCLRCLLDPFDIAELHAVKNKETNVEKLEQPPALFPAFTPYKHYKNVISIATGEKMT